MACFLAIVICFTQPVAQSSAEQRQKEHLPKELEALWADLGSVDASRQTAAVEALGGAFPQARLFIRGRLLEALPTSDAEGIQKLLRDLAGDRFELRQKASDELEKLGPAAEGALCRALADRPNLESRTRLDFLVNKLVARKLSVEDRQALWALALLQEAGTDDDRKFMQKLSKDAQRIRVRRFAENGFSQGVFAPQVQGIWNDLGSSDARIGFEAIQKAVNNPDDCLLMFRLGVWPTAEAVEVQEDAPPKVDELRVLRIIETLEHLGTKPARQLLTRLTKGNPQARATKEASMSLRRLAAKKTDN